ncbi:AMP-Hypothetical protein enzyme [Nesidiocoris tenuis]|uniref:AMP-dependent synthetase/ligase domain-containing protein n=1 Tax=Nesidiocoris tenuis TaxID=355587 RepID=A0ABN7AA26_9HEMI|nr:AMP-Hypothetical protein enzyme [Nesidiocoris tenuis]
MPIGGKEEIDERIAHCRDLPTLVLGNMRKFSNRQFLTDGLTGEKRTFKETMDDALSIAVKLREMGVGEGTIVAFLSDTTIEVFTFEIAVWLAGGCVCPINGSLTIDEICQILEISTASVVFCDGGTLPVFEKVQKRLNRKFKVITDAKQDTYITYHDLLSCDGSKFTPEPYDPDLHVAYVLFTSGTTGVPKGVMLSSFACLTNGCRAYQEDSSSLVTSPIYWLSSPACFVNALLQGTELIFLRVNMSTKLQGLHHLLSCIEKYKPGKWMSSPSVLLDLANLPEAKNFDLTSLTHLSVGGSAILASQKKFICDSLFFGKNIIQERYGCTEAGLFTRQWKHPPPDFGDKKSAGVGTISPGLEFKIMDIEAGIELGPNQVGELFVRSNAMMLGYINRDMPERYSKHDWYRVGDSCMYDEDGWIYFKARVKEIIKYRLLQMVPLDIEKVVIQHPDVLEVCVVGKPHPIDGEHPLAFVVRKANSNLTEEALAEFVNGQVSDEKRLRGGVIFKSELPKSGVGKILRRKLMDEVQLENFSSQPKLV